MLSRAAIANHRDNAPCDRVLTAKCLGCPNCLRTGKLADSLKPAGR